MNSVKEFTCPICSRSWKSKAKNPKTPICSKCRRLPQVKQLRSKCPHKVLNCMCNQCHDILRVKK